MPSECFESEYHNIIQELNISATWEADLVREIYENSRDQEYWQNVEDRPRMDSLRSLVLNMCLDILRDENKLITEGSHETL
jgi:hypothetical protein